TVTSRSPGTPTPNRHLILNDGGPPDVQRGNCTTRPRTGTSSSKTTPSSAPTYSPASNPRSPNSAPTASSPPTPAPAAPTNATSAEPSPQPNATATPGSTPGP